VAAACAVAAVTLLGPSDSPSHEPSPATASGRPSLDQPIPTDAVARLRAAVHQLTKATPGRPAARQARLIDYQVDSWQSPDDFTLEVSLDLHFAPGTATPWNQGLNDRFVRFSRQSDTQTYHLEWASAPFS
jgi:hypothetical protein